MVTAKAGTRKAALAHLLPMAHDVSGNLCQNKIHLQLTESSCQKEKCLKDFQNKHAMLTFDLNVKYNKSKA
jgi:hypothetical protein